MKTRPSATLIGMFVAGALALAVATLFFFGTRTWFGEEERFVVYFDESVHGLEIGAPVKFRGVRIGRITEIGIHYDAERGRSVMPVVCQVDRQVFRGPESEVVRFGDRRVLEQLVGEGLGARLALVGISGMMYLEMDYFDPQDIREPPLFDDSPYPVVPAARSTFAGLQESVIDIARDLEEVNFAAISRGIEDLVVRANATIDTLDLERLAGSLNEAAVALTELVRSEDLEGAIVSAETAFRDLSVLAQSLENRIDPVGEGVTRAADELAEMLNQLRQTITSVEDLLSPRSGVGPEMANTLRRLGDAARAVQRLADYLERNPNALVSGRRESEP